MWLTHPNNSVWGVFHEVTIEQEREAKEREKERLVEADLRAVRRNTAAKTRWSGRLTSVTTGGTPNREYVCTAKRPLGEML